MHTCYCGYMGRILWHDFFEIHIFSRDHDPAHFHVYFPKKNNFKGNVKIDINTLEVLELDGISRKDLSRLLDFLTPTRVEILKEEWERLHD